VEEEDLLGLDGADAPTDAPEASATAGDASQGGPRGPHA